MLVVLLVSTLLWQPACGPPDTRGGERGGASSDGIRAHGLATSRVCEDCHSNDPSTAAMRDAEGGGVAPYDLWRSSMMANSARDPFFRAVLSATTKQHPKHSGKIEAKCLRCHAPMASVAAHRKGTELRLEDLHGDGPIAKLGKDGASCVSCHAMTDEGFGTESSYDGGFVLNDDHRLFGPHPSPFARPMERRSGFEPAKGDHVLESEQCATCHTLFTRTITDGRRTNHHFPEQTPYLEWENSTYAEGDDAESCQDCHMPTDNVDDSPIRTRIARRPGGGVFPPTEPRSPVGRHLLVGGNYMIPAILRDARSQLDVKAPKAAFDKTIEAVKSQLRHDTATLAIRRVRSTGPELTFDVVVRNRTGHKFPTAYPSRRAWLHVRVLNEAGEVRFESGGWNEKGEILADGRPLPSEKPSGPVAPHRTTIETNRDVVIYQSVMEAENGTPTIGLLRAYDYAKDNRLLPKGWRSDHPDAEETRPVGVDDEDFIAGRDTVHVDLSVSGAARIEVELVYQPIGARWGAELFETSTAAIERFERMFRHTDRTPALVDSLTVEVP